MARRVDGCTLSVGWMFVIVAVLIAASNDASAWTMVAIMIAVVGGITIRDAG